MSAEPSFFACGIHIIWSGRVLLVQRSPTKQHPLTWSAVGGTIEDETPEDGIRRETHEETGITLRTVRLLSTTRYEHDEAFDYHQFLSVFEERPDIVLNDEHIGYGWYTIQEARGLDLVEDELELLEETYLLVGE